MFVTTYNYEIYMRCGASEYAFPAGTLGTRDFFTIFEWLQFQNAKLTLNRFTPPKISPKSE